MGIREPLCVRHDRETLTILNFFESKADGELETAPVQDMPSFVWSRILRLSSNVPSFRRDIPVNIGSLDVADLSFCSFKPEEGPGRGRHSCVLERHLGRISPLAES